ncbi:MAG: histidine phosphatase family protein [Opitutaceae bacterium]|nr:histidine phosphatase family protein [Opitutaceae bacterium]
MPAAPWRAILPSQPMELYLIRHAHALEAAFDEIRPLSPRGRKQIRALARWLRGTDAFAPREYWHSHLLRAADTAALLAARLRSRAPRRTVKGLAPWDDPALIADRLGRHRQSLALVGHEPHLSALASLLVTGRTHPPVFICKKCSVLALERIESRWLVRWQVSADLLG